MIQKVFILCLALMASVSFSFAEDAPTKLWKEVTEGKPIDSKEIPQEARKYSVKIRNTLENVFTHERSGGEGTGIIFSIDDKKGFIITNAHVAKTSDFHAQELKIFLNTDQSADSSEEVLGKLEFLSERFDSAIVSFDLSTIGKAKGLIKPAPIPSEALFQESTKQNAKVYAFGNPLSIENVLTAGNITAQPALSLPGIKLKDIEWMQLKGPVSMLQHNAAINPGNSGGPLINSETGVVVGINTLMLKETQQMYFATPLLPALQEWNFISNNRFQRKMRSIPVMLSGIRSGHLKFLPSSGTSPLKLFSDAIGNNAARAYDAVYYVTVAAPASRLQGGDIIVKVNDTPLGIKLGVGTNVAEIFEWVVDQTPGNEVKLSVIRGGELTEIKAPLSSGEDSDLSTNRETKYVRVNDLIFLDLIKGKNDLAFGSKTGAVVFDNLPPAENAKNRPRSQLSRLSLVTEVQVGNEFRKVANLDEFYEAVKQAGKISPITFVRYFQPLQETLFTESLIVDPGEDVYSYKEKSVASLRNHVDFSEFGGGSR
jgi:S1-C subfamily serine protease